VVAEEKGVNVLDKCRAYTRPLEAQAAGIYPFFTPIAESRSPEVRVGDRRLVMAGSNNYLGLTHDPRVRAAAASALEVYGTSCTGSRLQNGTIELHLQLEERLREFLGKEAVIAFSTGFQTNLGAIAALVSRHDAVFIDREDHASLVDGCQLALGDTYRFHHQDARDLERQLGEAGPDRGKLVAVDGVFSLRGDVIDLPAFVDVARRHDAALLVDDAHGIGVLGPGGRGTAAHHGLTDDVDLITGTFSKSLASQGGFLAGREDVIRFVKHTARELVFSASIPPADTAAAIAALEIVQQEPERIERLWSNTRRMKAGLEALGFDTCGSETPIIPVRVGSDVDTMRFWTALFDAGVFTNAVIAPAVAKGQGMIRTSCMATFTDEHLDRILSAFEHAARRLGMPRAETIC
jgi:8-amino-7-oxononanoate synthase